METGKWRQEKGDWRRETEDWKNQNLGLHHKVLKGDG
jgi:hypothetical protein